MSTDPATRGDLDAQAGDTDLRPATTRVFRLGLSGPGAVVGLVFFALSLLPSMLPRSFLYQGIVSGITVVIGYGLGAAGQWVWNFLGLPQLQGRARAIVVGLLLAIVAFLVASGTWQHVGWQNEVRAIYGMEPIGPIVLLPVLMIAAVVAALLLVIARSLRKLSQLTTHMLAKVLPPRLALLLGGVTVLVLLNLIYSDVLVDGFFAASNRAFSARDTGVREGSAQPDSALKSGSPNSLATWDSLGRQGRAFVSTGPTLDELNAFSGGGAVEPIRVYAGLKSAGSLQARADLVLDELIRTGAFDREVLVVSTTTGTGFLDANGVDPVEFIHNGDTAIAGVQYSFLPSWISLLADQDEVRQTAQMVFKAVHGYWSTLPESSRPRLYLYGLSLGSFGAEAILTSVNVVNEPIDGALLVGPPFVNQLSNQIIDDREDGTPPWQPIYADGGTVRFTGEKDALDRPASPWGPTRIAYLLHASDPVVFFSPDLLLTQPDWLKRGQRGPGITGDFVYVPLVTFWQMAFDLAGAGNVPIGWGHMYSPGANGTAWAAVTRPGDWTSAEAQALRDHLDERLRQQEAQADG